MFVDDNACSNIGVQVFDDRYGVGREAQVGEDTKEVMVVDSIKGARKIDIEGVYISVGICRVLDDTGQALKVLSCITVGSEACL